MKARRKDFPSLMMIVLLFVAIACTDPSEPSEGSRKATDAIIGFVLALNSQTCESFSDNRVVNLTQGVSSGPHSARTCFVVSTSATTTIQVTTSTTGETSIVPFSDEIVRPGISSDDPSTSVTSAGSNLKFVIAQPTEGNSYSVIVN